MRGRRMLVRVLAVLLSRGGVLLRRFVLANVVLMGGRMMMMRGGMMVSCGVMMMLARGMFRWLRHLELPLKVETRIMCS